MNNYKERNFQPKEKKGKLNKYIERKQNRYIEGIKRRVELEVSTMVIQFIEKSRR